MTRTLNAMIKRKGTAQSAVPGFRQGRQLPATGAE